MNLQAQWFLGHRKLNTMMSSLNQAQRHTGSTRPVHDGAQPGLEPTACRSQVQYV